MSDRKALGAGFVAVAAVLGLVLSVVGPVSAAQSDTGTTEASISQEVVIEPSSVITITSTSSGLEEIPANPSSTPFAVTSVQTLAGSTNDPDGFTIDIQIQDAGATNADGAYNCLFAGTDTTCAATSKVSAISLSGATLTDNTWGYYFNSSSSTPPTSASTFYGVPVNGSPAELFSTDAAGTLSGYLSYGAQVNYSLVSQEYHNWVIISITANP